MLKKSTSDDVADSRFCYTLRIQQLADEIVDD